MHALSTVRDHMCDASGRSLNILEPLSDTVALTTDSTPSRQVQSSGCLLVVSTKDGNKITHCAENALALLGIEPAAILTRSLESLLGEQATKQLLDNLSSCNEEHMQFRKRVEEAGDDVDALVKVEAEAVAAHIDAIKNEQMPACQSAFTGARMSQQPVGTPSAAC